MGDEQRTRSGFPQDPDDLLAKRDTKAGVERRERLVEQDDLGLRCQGAGEGHSLTLATGELVGIRPRSVREPDEREALLDSARRRVPEADVLAPR